MTSLLRQDGRRTCHQPRNVRTRQTVLRKHDRRLTCLWAPVKPDSVSYSHYIPESLFGGPRSRSTKQTFMLLHYTSHYHHYNLKFGNDDHSHPRRIISLEISNVDAGGTCRRSSHHPIDTRPGHSTVWVCTVLCECKKKRLPQVQDICRMPVPGKLHASTVGETVVYKTDPQWESECNCW